MLLKEENNMIKEYKYVRLYCREENGKDIYYTDEGEVNPNDIIQVIADFLFVSDRVMDVIHKDSGLYLDLSTPSNKNNIWSLARMIKDVIFKPYIKVEQKYLLKGVDLKCQ